MFRIAAFLKEKWNPFFYTFSFSIKGLIGMSDGRAMVCLTKGFWWSHRGSNDSQF